MALSAATARRFASNVGPTFNDLPVKSGVTVYAGGAYAIELATGFVYVPVGNDAAEVFVGIADETVVGDGAKTVRVRSEGIVELAVTGVDGLNDVGKAVYAVDDGSFSLTEGAADLYIGRVFGHVTGTTCKVAFRADALRGVDSSAVTA